MGNIRQHLLEDPSLSGSEWKHQHLCIAPYTLHIVCTRLEAPPPPISEVAVKCGSRHQMGGISNFFILPTPGHLGWEMCTMQEARGAPGPIILLHLHLCCTMGLQFAHCTQYNGPPYWTQDHRQCSTPSDAHLLVSVKINLKRWNWENAESYDNKTFLWIPAVVDQIDC